MHTLEPHYLWRNLYIASEDERSPFFEREYSEFEFTHAVYNYLIHPQWDFFGSATLYVKILYVDYAKAYAILEFIGEWNDLLYNDIMFLKREVIEILEQHGINKFILIGEYVMNYHTSGDDYYQEWYEEIEDGWIAMINFRKHVLEEFIRGRIHHYLFMSHDFNNMNWRVMGPEKMYEKVESRIIKRLQA